MKLFVVGLEPSVTASQLETLFSTYGRVINAKVIRDHETQVFKDFAFVRMETEEDGKLAIRKLNGYELESRSITVKKAHENEDIHMQMFTSLQKNIPKIEKALGYTFTNKALLTQSFLDFSFPLNRDLLIEDFFTYSFYEGGTNQDFISLSDFLLQLAIADMLETNGYFFYTDLKEDEKTSSYSEAFKTTTKKNMRIKHTNNDACVKYIDKLKVFKYYLGNPDSDEKNKPFKAKCFKSLLTAIYLDSRKDFSKICNFFLEHFSEDLLGSFYLSSINWKTKLNDFAQKNFPTHSQPIYKVVSQQGSKSSPVIKVQINVNGEKVAEGTSNSKKEAEQMAARSFYSQFFAGMPQN